MKWIVLLFELAAALGAGALVVTQIILPVSGNRPLFPFFRRKRRRLYERREDALQAKDDAELQAEIRTIQQAKRS